MAKDCCVFGCKTPVQSPEENDRLITWSRNIGWPETANVSSYRICRDHFDPSMFVDPKSMLSLIPNAIPTLNLPSTSVLSEEPTIKQEQEDIDETTSQCTDDDNKESEILALENEIAKIFTHSNTINISKKEVDKSDSYFKYMFSKWQEMAKKKYTKHEYEQKFRLFCINLYCYSPKAYKTFEKCLSLPSRKILENTKLIFTGNDQNLIKLLSQRLSKMPANSKYVILCIHEMPLSKRLYYDIRQDEIIGYHKVKERKHLLTSENVVVFRIKGCLQNYQQTIGYKHTGAPYDYRGILEFIKSTIGLLFRSGFEVCAIVANQNDHIEHLTESFDANIDHPFIKVKRHKVFFIYDIPLLMNLIRDNLLKNDFLYGDEKRVSWEHVKEFYSEDIKRKIRMAPKLTAAHIQPNSSEMKNVQLTKQVFSYSVAAGISAAVEAQYLPPEASETAEFLMQLNNLYDLLDLNKQNGFVDYASMILDLQNSRMMFKNIKLFERNLGKDQECFHQMATSISAVLHLHEYFSKQGIKSISTRRLHLNSDKMISLFKHYLQGRLLTPIQFRRCFSKLVLQDLLNSSNVNCKHDLRSTVFSSTTINDFSLLKEYFPGAPKTSPLAVGCIDYRFNLPQRSLGGFKFPTGYLFNKCLKMHQKCRAFQEYVARNKNGDKRPPQDFIDYVHKCERWILRIGIFEFESTYGSKIGETLLKAIKTIEPVQPCPCFPLEYLNKLFLRLHIYNTLKLRNRTLKSFRD